jgi:hypothetical protein
LTGGRAGRRQRMRRATTRRSNARPRSWFRDSAGNECRRRNLVIYRMPTPPAHPMNDGLGMVPCAGAVSLPPLDLYLRAWVFVWSPVFRTSNQQDQMAWSCPETFVHSHHRWRGGWSELLHRREDHAYSHPSFHPEAQRSAGDTLGRSNYVRSGIRDLLTRCKRPRAHASSDLHGPGCDIAFQEIRAMRGVDTRSFPPPGHGRGLLHLLHLGRAGGASGAN